MNERLYGKWRKVVGDIITEGQTSGDFRQDVDPDSLANRFVALMDGLAIQVLLHSPEMTVAKMRRVLGDFVTSDISSVPIAAGGS
jgi:BetI-type transcriptional repressor, C-terminal